LLGAFATWQAEWVIGDHDRNTLRLNARLRSHDGITAAICRLRPCPAACGCTTRSLPSE
jgi:hypothetical protein